MERKMHEYPQFSRQLDFLQASSGVEVLPDPSEDGLVQKFAELDCPSFQNSVPTVMEFEIEDFIRSIHDDNTDGS